MTLEQQEYEKIREHSSASYSVEQGTGRDRGRDEGQSSAQIQVRGLGASVEYYQANFQQAWPCYDSDTH
jgi:hypothetical protein